MVDAARGALELDAENPWPGLASDPSSQAPRLIKRTREDWCSGSPASRKANTRSATPVRANEASHTCVTRASTSPSTSNRQ